MSCISITSYFPIRLYNWFHNKRNEEAPRARLKIYEVIQEATRETDQDYGTSDIIEKVKHFASPNILSVSEPEVIEDVFYAIKYLVPKDMTSALKFLESAGNERNPEYLKETYIKMVKDSWGGELETFMLEREEGEFEAVKISFIDIEFIDHQTERLFFISSSRAKAAIQLIKDSL